MRHRVRHKAQSLVSGLENLVFQAGDLSALLRSDNREWATSVSTDSKSKFSSPDTGLYFKMALGSPKFAIQKKCSYFALENKDWVIVGLDSAYYSDEDELYEHGSLYPSDGPRVQLDFLRTQVEKGKKIIVLTHHDGLSMDGSTPNELWKQVTSAFPEGAGPAYWYWGHVHAGTVYYPCGLANVLCRCCGHGAIPWGQASRLANSQHVLWHEHRPAHDPDVPQRVLNGFAVLHFDGPNLQETFYDENGGVAWQST